MQYVKRAPQYATMFRRNPGEAAVVQAIQSLTPWGGFGSSTIVNPSKISAFAGFSGFGKGCAGTEDGLANDPIARVIGCPDCPGMTAIAGTTKYTICYWLKRPMGQIGALVIIAGLGYVIYKAASGAE